MSKTRLILERLEERILLAADPVAAIDIAATDFIDEDINFKVSFENDAANNNTTDVGYQPHLDVVVEKGINVSSAAYLGSSVTLNAVAFWDTTDSRWEDAVDGSGAAFTGHPQDSTGAGAFSQPSAGNQTGDVWYSIQLPFGSFTYDQPKVEIDFSASLDSTSGALVGTPLGIKAIGNFAFGDADALNNPATDAPVQGAEVSASITPTVWTINKSVIAPEGETATGPSFPRTWQIEIDIANNQTVTDIDITDLLPSNLVYVDGTLAINTSGAAAASGQNTTQIPMFGQVNNPTDNDFLIEFDLVTGTTGKEIVITYQTYVNDLDANAGNVINPSTGDDSSSTNNATADGKYLTNDLAQISDSVTLQDKSIAIQKSVEIIGGGAVIPGAVAKYTLNFQISDYFSFDELVIDDLFSDGLRFDNTFTPTFTVTEDGAIINETAFNTVNFDVTLNDTDVNASAPRDDGSTDVQFRLSDQLSGTAVGAELSGDQFNGSAAGSGGTIGTITFQVSIQEDFSDTFDSGDNSVDMGDVLTNTVTITGNVKNTDGSDTGSSESDGSAANLTIEQIAANKAIYAINGVVGSSDALSPGDTVTYRIRVDLSNADAENFVITDFLPLPVLTATTITANTFNAGPSAASFTPVAGSAAFGSDHTLNTVTLVRDDGSAFNGVPTVSTNATNNTVAFDFGSFDDNGAGSGAQVVDILFTVAANDEPFGDGLFLTNQALVGIGSTNNAANAITDIVQIEVEEPQLLLKKGIVSTDAVPATFDPATVGPVVFDAPNDGTQPFAETINSAGLAANSIDSNLTGIDGGDLVKFSVVLENTGQDEAFDLLFNDQLPEGFNLPTSTEGLNFKVYNGAGTQLTFVDETGAVLATDTAIANKFFSTTAGEGVRVVDTGSGAIAAGKDSSGATVTSGENIIIITYDLQAKADINTTSVHVGTAELVEYAVKEGGNDFTDGNTGPWEDDATVTAIAPAAPVKTLIDTEFDITNNSDIQAVIGETVQYSVVITLPEGNIPIAQLRDILDDGLTFGSLDSIVASGDVSSSLGALTTANKAAFNPTVTTNTQEQLLFDFGTLSNTNTNNATAETITLTYTVQVENISGIDQGDTLDNQARFQWDGDDANSTAGSDSSERTSDTSADNVSIIEPLINTSISAAVKGSGTTGDVDDSVVYTIILTSESGRPEAFDATFSDVIPSDVTINPGGVTVVHSADGNLFTGGGSGDFELSGNTIRTATGKSFDLADGETVTITVTGVLGSSVNAGQTISNSATTQWTSIDGAGPNISGDADGERIGSGGINDYAATENIDIDITNPGLTKTLTATEINDATNSNTEAVIGEWVRYTLVLTVPEATANSAKIVDTLDAGLAFFDVESVTPSSVDVTFTGSPLSPTIGGSNGGTITFDFGNISNSNTDNATAETITIVYRALVTNVSSNQSTVNDSGPNLDNSAVFSWNDGATTQSLSSVNAADVIVIEPKLTVSQTVRVDSDNNGFDAGDGTTGDFGDDVEYIITIAHSGNSEADAYDLVLNNTLPGKLNSLTIASVAGTGSVVASDFAIVGGTLQVASGKNVDLVNGQTIILTVTGTLDNTVSASEVITNKVDLQWSSLDGDITDRSSAAGVVSDDERAGAGSAADTGDYNATNSTDITITTPTIGKTITATSESHTGVVSGLENVAIGEIVRYRLQFKLPEGTTNNIIFKDDLVDGLQYLDGSTKVAFIANGAGISSSDTTASGGEDWSVGPGAAVSGNALVSPTFVLGDENVSILEASNSDAHASGTEVYFKLGDLLNADSDTDAEYVVVEFNTLVLNSSGSNDAGDTRANNSELLVNGSTIATSTSVTTRIAEPVIDDLAKTITVTPSDAGDTITYQYKFSNAATGDGAVAAFDIKLLDSLDSNLDLVNVTDVTFSTTGSGSFTNNSNITTDTVDVILDQLDPGESVTITVVATVKPTAPAGIDINSTANLTYTSLPGANGTTGNATGSDIPGTSGANNGERDGSASLAANDYNDSASISTTLNTPTIDQLQPVPAEYAIGETVTYDIIVTLPEGDTRGLQVSDALPPGLSFVSSTIITTAAASSGALSNDFNGTVTSPSGVSGGGSGDDVSWNFGDTTTVNSNATNDNQFIIRVTALVENEAGNQDQPVTSLVADAEISWTNPNDTSTDTFNDPTDPVITVIEPILEISKTLTSSNTGVDAGDTVEYTLEIKHSTTPASSADSFDLNITDQLPTELENITIVSGLIGATDVSGSLTINGSEQLVSTANAIDLLQGETLTIVVRGTVQDDVNPDDLLSSAATVTWTSINGTNTNERGGSGGINDYTASNSAVDVTITDPFALAKTASASTAVIGENITYTLEVTVVEGTTNNLSIVDTLPVGMIYGGDAIVSNANGMTITNFNVNPSGQVLTLTADSILNPGNVDGASAADSDSFFITYSVRVDNVIANQQDTTLINDADASADNVTGDIDNQTTVTVNEPVLAVTTNTSGVPATPNIGDTFQFIASVDHTTGAGVSTATAYDLQLSDTMPPELKIISIDSIGGTNTLGLTPADFIITGGGSGWILNPGFDLDLADDFNLTYTVEIQTTIALNQTVANDLDISWDSRDGTDTNARDGSDGVSGVLNDYAATANTIVTSNNLSISKAIATTDQIHTSASDVVIGETITYELTINLSEETTTNVVVNDTLPQQLNFIPGSLSVLTGNSGMTTQFIDESTSLSFDSNTRVITVNLGDIANPGNANTSDDKLTLTYQAVVENIVDNQSGNVKSNNVIVTSTGGSASDSTDVVILEPELAISLTVSNETPIIDETVEYTLTVDHTSISDTDAYDLTLTNLLADPDLTITSIDSIGGTNSGGLTVNDFVITTDGSGVTFAAPGTLDLSLADDFTLVFSVKVSGDPGAVGNVNDIAVDLSWSSTDGGNSNERDGGGGVNDYSASINQNVTLLPIPPQPALPVFVFDAAHNDAEQTNQDSFFFRTEERLFTLPPLPIFPIFSGATEPGTTLTFKLYNEAGSEIGSQTVIADTGGNWLASFPGNIIFDQPHSMRIEQTASMVNDGGAHGFNLRTYFSPAMNEQLFFSNAFTVDTVFSNTASASMQAIHQGLNNPFNLGGGDFYAYEYLSSSSTTAQGI